MFTNLNGSKVPRDARTISWIVPANFTAMCASMPSGVAGFFKGNDTHQNPFNLRA